MFEVDENSNSSVSSSCQFNLLDILVDNTNNASGSPPSHLYQKLPNSDTLLTCSETDKNLVRYFVSDNQEVSLNKNALCMSKNAITARESRRKKKEYVSSLENEITLLKSENEELKSREKMFKKCLQDCKAEVNYLKGVIANQSLLSKLLENIQNVPGVKFNTSFSIKSNDSTNRSIGRENEKDKILPDEKLSNNLSRKRSVIQQCDNEEGIHIETRSAQKKHKVNKLDKVILGKSESEDVLTGEETVDLHVYDDTDSNDPSGGICLHVSNENISIEFCSKCSQMANQVTLDHSYGKELNICTN